MNQILYTGGKNKKSGTNDTQKIIIFFVIIIIIFAICAIGIGTNLLSKVKNQNNNNTTGDMSNTSPGEQTKPVEPNIEIKFDSQLGEIKVTVTNTINIANISYWWNEETPTTKEVNQKEYELTIPSKQGTHTLNIEVTDEKGNQKTEQQVVIGDSEPELTITTDKISNYIIKVKDDEEVKKIVIKLNDEIEEVEVNAKEFEYKVPIPEGYSLIDVTAYNLNDIPVNRKAQITNFKSRN